MSAVETATPETVQWITERTFLRDQEGKTSSSRSGVELLGPGQNIPHAWSRFMHHYPRHNSKAWVRHLWQSGGVVAQLLATANHVNSNLWAGWALNESMSGYKFAATFDNGPITQRGGLAKIFMDLWIVGRRIAYVEAEAHYGIQPLEIYLHLDVPVDKVRVGALCQMRDARANAYAETICRDIKVRRYSRRRSLEPESEALDFEGQFPEFGDEALSPLSDEEKASGQWVDFPS